MTETMNIFSENDFFSFLSLKKEKNMEFGESFNFNERQILFLLDPYKTQRKFKLIHGLRLVFGNLNEIKNLNLTYFIECNYRGR